ncbi:SDR family NAD(P)-dependent oxidoreductase [Corynebacterium durum]|uniref:SDR family oxidoreductase n=1 Tax=Corynebacterium durum TaxID=61592 RepID=UPI0028E7257B|nr:SDR family NAD(P)-dependent oxidoreductase [Corynebacterium durum]
MTTRTIVVAGGSSGIGLAVAQKAVADGWRTIIVDRQEPIELVDATFFHCDLLDNDSAHQVLDGIVRDQERIDALVISAGGVMNGRLESKTMEEWDNYYSNDTLLVLRTTHMLLPRLREAAEHHGIADIVVMGSIAGTTAFEDAAVYGSISAARNALGEQLRLELRGERIRARTIATGYVETPLTKRMSMNAVTEQVGQDPLRPRDIAEIVYHGINLPPEVTVHNIVVVPTKQGWA